MAYIVMAYIVSYGLYRPGLYSLYSYGLYSYGLYSYGGVVDDKGVLRSAHGVTLFGGVAWPHPGTGVCGHPGPTFWAAGTGGRASRALVGRYWRRCLEGISGQVLEAVPRGH